MLSSEFDSCIEAIILVNVSFICFGQCNLFEIRIDIKVKGKCTSFRPVSLYECVNAVWSNCENRKKIPLKFVIWVSSRQEYDVHNGHCANLGDSMENTSVKNRSYFATRISRSFFFFKQFIFIVTFSLFVSATCGVYACVRLACTFEKKWVDGSIRI